MQSSGSSCVFHVRSFCTYGLSSDWQVSAGPVVISCASPTFLACSFVVSSVIAGMSRSH